MPWQWGERAKFRHGVGKEELGAAHPVGTHSAGRAGLKTVSGRCHEKGHQAWCSPADAIGGKPSFYLGSAKGVISQQCGAVHPAGARNSGCAGRKPSVGAVMKADTRPGARPRMDAIGDETSFAKTGGRAPGTACAAWAPGAT